jgi:iron complex outermembrane receptor protein
MPRNVSKLTAMRVGLVLCTALTAPALHAQTAAPVAEAPAQDAIVVTGYRRSLEAALNLKKNSVAAVDAIVAEDIAKFPDQNLAESLQRIPGISIQRDGGEGRSITVRGLSAQFTRVRVNGMETVATSQDGASANRDRAFDFNVFASELFTSLVVHKTAEPSLDEGSLGAVVDLNTGNPLGGKAGLTAVANVQGSYNDLSKNLGPRLAGLLSWRNDEGTFGVNVSAAYSKLNTVESGNNTVRWAQAPFNSVNGTNCYYSVAAATGGSPVTTGGSYRPSSACDQAALSFHPRIPRYGVIEHRRERLGLTGSIQWKPSDRTKLSIDGLFSQFRADREEKWIEVLARTNERRFDVVSPVYDSNNNMISATINNAWVRSEHYLRQSKTTFYQVGATLEQDITDKLKLKVLAGTSKSDAQIPLETTMIMDNRNANGFFYDYTNMSNPVIRFGDSVTDPSKFQLAEIRDRPSFVTNRFKTISGSLSWDVTEGFTVKTGGVWRRFTFDTASYQRDTAVCGSSGADLVLGAVTCSATTYGLPVTAAMVDTVNLGNAGQASGTTSSYLVPNLAATTAYTKLYSRAANPVAGDVRGVSETTSGGYLQFDFKRDIFGLETAGNMGVRYAHTAQKSNGILSGVMTTVERSYNDWLPSANLAFFPSKKWIIRAAYAKVVTRPTLGNLTPGGSVDGFNFRVTNGNPFLDPFRADNYDLAVEYYFAPQSVFSVAVFKKDISSFPVAGTFQATLGQLGLGKDVLPTSSPAYLNYDPNQLYLVSSNVNGKGASLKGVEVALQMPFKFLPGVLKNIGYQGNITYVDSHADYTITGAATNACVRATAISACALGGALPRTYGSSLLNVSKLAWNATLYYDDGKFSIRGSLSYRGPFRDGISATGNVFEGYSSYTSFDASLRYKIRSNIELSVDGNNLLDTYRYRYTDITAQRNYENNHFGRVVQFGARWKY